MLSKFYTSEQPKTLAKTMLTEKRSTDIGYLQDWNAYGIITTSHFFCSEIAASQFSVKVTSNNITKLRNATKASQ
jgi:hypothetical protein